MHKKHAKSIKLTRIPDTLLPLSFLASSLLRREYAALLLFVAMLSARLCALATSNGLRSAFSRQPSMRCVQGSTLIALCLQPVGGLIAALLLRSRVPFPFFIAGILLNIEHVFYEYLYAVGDDRSAALCRTLTAVLNLTGLILSFPPTKKMALPVGRDPVWMLATALIVALVAFVIGMVMGGDFKPKLTPEILRIAPLSLLQTALYPALALVVLSIFRPYSYTALPLFAGLIPYELFRTPFRRAPIEASSMNRSLLILCAAASLCTVACYYLFSRASIPVISLACGNIILSALCLFALFGNFIRREGDLS